MWVKDLCYFVMYTLPAEEQPDSGVGVIDLESDVLLTRGKMDRGSCDQGVETYMSTKELLIDYLEIESSVNYITFRGAMDFFGWRGWMWD